MKKKIYSLILPAVIILTLIFSGCSIVTKNIYTTPNSTTTYTNVYTTNSNAGQTDLTTSISNVKDSVVEIYSLVRNGYACGSGVIFMTEDKGLKNDYYIITNFHVIENGTQLTVITTFNNKQYSASLISGDYYSDIAVIRISTSDILTVATLYGSYDENGDELDKDNNNTPLLTLENYLKFGQTVFAIGNPLGELPGSVSVGNISYINRVIEVEGISMTLLQTTSAINSGNSGGGLFDEHGNLIGIVNAKVKDEGVEGLGFAIPINYAYKMASQLYKTYSETENEVVSYGYIEGRTNLGLTLKTSNNLVYVYSIGNNSPCLTAVGNASTTLNGTPTTTVNGLNSNDILYSINDSNVTTTNYKNLIKSVSIGSTLNLTVIRTVREYQGFTYKTVEYYITFNILIEQYIYQMPTA